MQVINNLKSKNIWVTIATVFLILIVFSKLFLGGDKEETKRESESKIGMNSPHNTRKYREEFDDRNKLSEINFMGAPLHRGHTDSDATVQSSDRDDDDEVSIILREEEEKSNIMKKENFSRMTLQSRFMSIKKTCDSENKAILVSKFCLGLCDPDWEEILQFSVAENGSDRFYDIKNDFLNDWWRFFFGGSVHSMKIIKYMRTTDDEILLAIHSAVTKDKILIQKTISGLGKMWTVGTDIIKKTTSSLLNLATKILIIGCSIIFVYFSLPLLNFGIQFYNGTIKK